jgi:hypothetical protein
MSSNYCTIECKKCAAPIRIPDDRDTKFACGNCGTFMESRGINIIIDNQLSEVDSIANDIDDSLRKIATLLKGFETAKSFSQEEGKIQKAIAKELPLLYNKITQHYSNHREASAKAFKKTFVYTHLFDKPQTLDLILAAVYAVILTIRQNTMFDFFTDVDHEVYAFNVVQSNKSRLAATANSNKR